MSRAGSQVMNMGRRAGRPGMEEEEEDGGEAEVVGGLTKSIMADILSSSSGQMSGQCVKPK